MVADAPLFVAIPELSVTDEVDIDDAEGALKVMPGLEGYEREYGV